MTLDPAAAARGVRAGGPLSTDFVLYKKSDVIAGHAESSGATLDGRGNNTVMVLLKGCY